MHGGKALHRGHPSPGGDGALRLRLEAKLDWTSAGPSVLVRVVVCQLGRRVTGRRVDVSAGTADLRGSRSSPSESNEIMPDVLDRIHRELHARLEELRPLVDEQRRLEAALQALGGVPIEAPSAPSASPPTPKRSRAGKPASGQSRTGARRTSGQPRKRAPRGANRDALLRALGEHPGATSAELASASGVDRNTLYALLARLVKAGELHSSKLPSGRTGYSLNAAPPDA
jgi:hypothetical protein